MFGMQSVTYTPRDTHTQQLTRRQQAAYDRAGDIMMTAGFVAYDVHVQDGRPADLDSRAHHVSVRGNSGALATAQINSRNGSTDHADVNIPGGHIHFSTRTVHPITRFFRRHQINRYEIRYQGEGGKHGTETVTQLLRDNGKGVNLVKTRYTIRGAQVNQAAAKTAAEEEYPCFLGDNRWHYARPQSQ
jgi:hypothetical protein